jgi:hypothetical protein
MKKLVVKVKNYYKETTEQRQDRVKNQKVYKSAVFKSKKDYNRQKYKKFDINYYFIICILFLNFINFKSADFTFFVNMLFLYFYIN